VPFGRRLKFTILVLISQLLLIALAMAWVVHMVLIAKNGAVYFVEGNSTILWAEIGITTLITLFATAVFAIEVYRLGERRKGDERRGIIARRGGAELRGTTQGRRKTDARQLADVRELINGKS
jgi:uncharacterized BrkB/YihY/UPF0761 family membrane protein